jgi:CBS domain-containing protein
MIVGGISMIFGAEIPFFGTGFVNGLWLAFIGWFLNNAAAQSYQQLVIQNVLEDVTVSEMMRNNPPTVPPDCAVSDLVHEHVMGTDDQAFPVIEGGHLIGLVTLDDIRGISRDAWDSTTVREIMTSADEMITAQTDEEASEALNKLTQNDIRQLPVLQDGELAGLLRRRDMLRWLQLHSDVVSGKEPEGSALGAG